MMAYCAGESECFGLRKAKHHILRLLQNLRGGIRLREATPRQEGLPPSKGLMSSKAFCITLFPGGTQSLASVLKEVMQEPLMAKLQR